MSTKIGIISEGPIDHVLLPPLLEHIARSRAAYTWPVDAGDVAELLPIRKTGHGGVLEKVRMLVHLLEREPLGYAVFVIVLDRRTRQVQDEIKQLIHGKDQFVLGIAIEELEAWWLGDRTNTLRWTGFTPATLPRCRYSLLDASGHLAYVAEKDLHPKRTLHELTECSDRFDRTYGEGNVDLASQFAEEYWRPNARLDEIASQCPHGFGAFQIDMANSFRHAKARAGRLF